MDLSLLHYGKVGITGRTTANCYIVNGPGWYKLPCIFGNALKNGSPNPSAWTSAAAAGNPDVLYRFVDHTGAGIGEGNGLDGQPMTDQTAPYIYNKYTITDAGLLWQDVEGMVADVSTDGQNITFRVTDKIAYGNAVVVAYAGSDIVWSWHIWATDYDPYAAYDPGTGNGIMSVQNQTGENRTLNFMLQNLGNCPGMKYEARTQHLLLTERASGAALVVKVERQAGKDLHNTPYYQWGRKDPLPGILPDWNNKKIYGAAVATDAWPAMQGSPNILKPSASGTAYISQCIEFPYLFAAVERNDNTKIDNRYYNLWSADNTAADVNTNKVVKTVYDPSPAGFCVPPSGAFTGFTLTGTEATEDVTNINADGDWEQGWGWYFFQNTNKNGNTIHFPTTGFRDQNSRGYSLDIVGYSWLAGPSNNEWPRYTYNFFFNHINTVQPHNYRGGARENALPIRCVQEF